MYLIAYIFSSPGFTASTEETNLDEYRRELSDFYVDLFSQICKAANIHSETISGYTKFSEGKQEPSKHRWNAVYIYSQWRLIDITMAAGKIRLFLKR